MKTTPPKLRIGKKGNEPMEKTKSSLGKTLSGALPPLMQLLGQTAPNNAPPQPGTPPPQPGMPPQL